MKEIKLILIDPRKPIYYAKVDDKFFDQLSKYEWAYVKKKTGIYAYICVAGKTIYMHNLILGYPPESELQVDHINSDPLDNQELNLRFATRQQQAANVLKRRGEYSSKYKGVSWYKKGKCWRVRIKYNYQEIFVGNFIREKDAALAYNKAIVKYFGDYAKLNEIED
jgi:hypothetical protein